ncbi:S8 family serine peptidase [Spirosoma taeanense]|uniref:S8 family serine peptidase n=1 Tax=Spirosoma taeanense TaxID=2735870 RepID=A0A6M5YET0_9BACT|nr:S8 family serine peptidase [Spirosoma taeanense]QJW91502.1 S8 family serine peptidase [Spirosoma taeanense]
MKHTLYLFAGLLLMGLTGLDACRPAELAVDNSLQSVDAAQAATATGGIDGQYIVVLKQDAFSAQNLETFARQQARLKQVGEKFLSELGINPENILHVYGAALSGMAVRLTPAELARLRKNPLVSYIEADRQAVSTPDGLESQSDKTARVAAGQEVPWGITYVGGSVNYAGSNVAYVIDSGIELTHPDLKVDSTKGYSVFKFGAHRSTKDFDGHGTLVSGIIAALNNTIGVVGVAAGATVVPIKVCAAPTKVVVSDFIAGINFVAANARPGDVANISLGISATDAVDQAVVNMASKGIFVAVSAGNTNVNSGVSNANQISPARANGPTIFTASGHDKNGVFATVSCVGNPPIDFAAPAVNVKSTYKGGGYLTITQGTTAATAHLSGILLANSGTIYANGTVTNDPDGTPDPKGSRISPIANR